MENGSASHHTNGKSNTSLVHVKALVPESGKFDQVLELVKEVVHLELQLTEKRSTLATSLQELGHGELPSLLVGLARATALPQKPSLAKTKVLPSKVTPNRGGALKARVMGLMSDGKERRSKNIIRELKANSGSVYAVLTELVAEEHLMKTKFAHYRLKLRRR